MTNIWFISDTHFNHSNILKFINERDQVRIRKEFPADGLDEMNETLIENWNKTIAPSDKVYHLGDVALGNVKDFHNIMRRLNGKKRLVMGNHDCFDILDYAQHFEKIMSWRQMKHMPKPFIACHYPLHEDSLFGRNAVYCVHGHIHQRTIKIVNNKNKIDSILNNYPDDHRYINVCVEKINYTPVHIDELQARMK